jgi:hypothetical protein
MRRDIAFSRCNIAGIVQRVLLHGFIGAQTRLNMKLRYIPGRKMCRKLSYIMMT